MSLKSFHIIFITLSISLMIFTGIFSVREGFQPGLLASSVAGLACALGYLRWFLRKYRTL
jgi:hypothetical protein